MSEWNLDPAAPHWLSFFFSLSSRSPPSSSCWTSLVSHKFYQKPLIMPKRVLLTVAKKTTFSNNHCITKSFIPFLFSDSPIIIEFSANYLIKSCSSYPALLFPRFKEHLSLSRLLFQNQLLLREPHTPICCA